MRIKWLGHSCFKITNSRGIRIVTDPFDDNVGYKVPAVETDIVTVSHGHYDHNFVDCVKGNYEVVSKVGNFYVKDVAITGVHTYHDEENGSKRGGNISFIFEMDDVRICHMGDIGHVLSPAQIEMIGRVDVLLIPVGGVYTVDANGAAEIVSQLKPSAVIPMHYKTPALKFNLSSADVFVELVGGAEKVQSQVVEINRNTIHPEQRKIYILRYE